MGKQEMVVENRSDESHGQSRSCCDHFSESQTPRRAAPARGSLRGSSVNSLKPQLLPAMAPCWGLLWPPAPWNMEHLWGQKRLLLPHQEVKGTLTAVAQQGTLVLPTSQKLAGTSPHSSPHGKAGGSTAPRALARGEQAGGTSLSHWEQPLWHGMDLVPALLSTDELRITQRVFRNQNRMFPGCQPAAQGYQPELTSPPPSPALLRVLPSGHCLLIDTGNKPSKATEHGGMGA